MNIKSVCVFCGAKTGTNSEYTEAAHELGRVLVSNGIRLVYGGAQIGVMGAVAEEVLKLGGEAVGVIPEALKKKEVAHEGLTKLHVVGSMHERKALLAELSDAFVALPGGLGTMEEIFEVLTWAQLGFHFKPCGFLNVAGYFTKLLDFIDYAVNQGFIKEAHRRFILSSDSPEDILQQFKDYEAPYTDRVIALKEKL